MQTATEDITTLRTAGGRLAVFSVRPGTNDGALVHGIITGAEYPFDRLRGLSGWAIDVGAHIGIVAVALALDNPDLRIIAVEALPENVTALRRNIALNGLADRIHIEAAAASSEEEYADGTQVPIVYGWAHAENQPDHYMVESQFIGGMVGPNDSSRTAMCSALSLGAIRDRYDMDDVVLLKIDCEGCEWFFLTSPDVAAVEHIIGEMHIGKHGGAKELRAMLEPTHTVTVDDKAVVGIFEAVRK